MSLIHSSDSGNDGVVVTYQQVNRENNSFRIFCVDNLDRMSVLACIRNVSLPYLMQMTRLQTPRADTGQRRAYLDSKPEHRLRGADRQLGCVPAAILVNHAL